MTTLTAVRANIVTLDVDAIVNAAEQTYPHGETPSDARTEDEFGSYGDLVLGGILSDFSKRSSHFSQSFEEIAADIS